MRIRFVPSLLALLGTLACGTDTAPVGSGLLGDGGGTGTGTGSDGGTRSGTGTDSGVCEVHDVGNGRVPPDILIVLDRSGSMKGRGVNRWDPSVSALKSITSSLDKSVSFGLMTFPGNGTAAGATDCSTITDFVQQAACWANQLGGAAGGGGGASCAAGTVNVPVAPNQAAMIAQVLDGMQPGGATPTAVSLAAAHQALGSGRTADVDARAVPKYVLLVTDGQPNCTGNGNNGGGDQQAVADSVSAIQGMTDDGIKTYVLGYGTQNDQAATAALNQMAQAGGTGDQMYRPINDEASLLAEFQSITGSVVTCEFTLDTPPEDPDYVSITLDGTPLKLDDPNGWSISVDHRRVTVLGSACGLVKSNTGHALSVKVECNRVTLR